jgi:hypothetical protein
MPVVAPAAAAIRVADPAIDIQIRNENNDVVNDKSVIRGEQINFRIVSNLDAFTARGGVAAAPSRIRVTDPNGNVYTSLVNSAGVLVNLGAGNPPAYNPDTLINTNPFAVAGGANVWDTGNAQYARGTYTFKVDTNANAMNDNYDVVGKTVSKTYSITIADDDLVITATKDTVVRGNDFAVTITGRPNTAYALWTKGTSTLAAIEVPEIKPGQQGVALDGGVGTPGRAVGDYIFTAGQTVGGDTPTGIAIGSPFYAQVTINNAGTRTIGFGTTRFTKVHTFTIRVQELVPVAVNPLHDEVEVSIEAGAITIVASGDKTYYIGEDVTFSGTNTDSHTVYFFITGPNIPPEGGQLPSPMDPVVDQEQETFWSSMVRSDNTYGKIWETRGLSLEAGSYSVYALTDPRDRNNILHANDYDTVDIILLTDAPVTTTYGVYRNGLWILKDGTRTNYGTPTDIPVVVDGKIGVYRNGLWIIKGVEERVWWGTPTDVPVVVDGTIGVYRNGLWILKDGTREQFGTPTDIPVVVDDKIGVYRNGLWILKDGTRTHYGTPTDIPVVVDGKIGVYRNGLWIIKDGVREQFGLPTDIPVFGAIV